MGSTLHPPSLFSSGMRTLPSGPSAPQTEQVKWPDCGLLRFWLARTGVDQSREQFERVPIGKGHLVRNGLLYDAGNGYGTQWYARSAMHLRVIAEPRGKR